MNKISKWKDDYIIKTTLVCTILSGPIMTWSSAIYGSSRVGVISPHLDIFFLSGDTWKVYWIYRNLSDNSSKRNSSHVTEMSFSVWIPFVSLTSSSSPQWENNFYLFLFDISIYCMRNIQPLQLNLQSCPRNTTTYIISDSCRSLILLPWKESHLWLSCTNSIGLNDTSSDFSETSTDSRASIMFTP